MRRIRQRRIVALVATAACAAALAGCGRQEGAGPPVLHFYTPADGAAQYAAAADDCTAAAGGRYSVVETLPKSADDQRAYQSISIVVADLLNPPSQIDMDTIVPRLAEQVEQAVQSEGLVP